MTYNYFAVSYNKVKIMTLASIFLFIQAFLISNSSAELFTSFYAKSCPNLTSIVETTVKEAIKKETRIGASLLRLHFHDCFVKGCDASVLLRQERVAAPNKNSLRGFDVVETIKTAVEEQCNNTVSCADILAIAARDSVSILGGYYWDVKLGRRDAINANTLTANLNIPSPSSNLTQLLKNFTNHKLNETDLVVLSGAHTIGLARCVSFKKQIYNDTGNINATFARELQHICPKASGPEDNNTAPLDVLSRAKFDNKYYKDLVNKKGLLFSDQQLYSQPSTEIYKMVEYYANNNTAFLKDFAISMIKMGDMSPLTGNQGEIRKICSKPNHE